MDENPLSLSAEESDALKAAVKIAKNNVKAAGDVHQGANRIKGDFLSIGEKAYSVNAHLLPAQLNKLTEKNQIEEIMKKCVARGVDTLGKICTLPKNAVVVSNIELTSYKVSEMKPLSPHQDVWPGRRPDLLLTQVLETPKSIEGRIIQKIGEVNKLYGDMSYLASNNLRTKEEGEVTWLASQIEKPGSGYGIRQSGLDKKRIVHTREGGLGIEAGSSEDGRRSILVSRNTITDFDKFISDKAYKGIKSPELMEAIAKRDKGVSYSKEIDFSFSDTSIAGSSSSAKDIRIIKPGEDPDDYVEIAVGEDSPIVNNLNNFVNDKPISGKLREGIDITKIKPEDFAEGSVLKRGDDRYIRVDNRWDSLIL